MNKTPFQIIVLALIIFAVGFVGCESDDDSPTGSGGASGDIMPLAMGNYWINENESYLNDTLTTTYIDTFSIDTSLVHDGFTWYGDKDRNQFYRTDDSSVWEIHISEGSPIVPFQMFRENAQANESWYFPVGDDSAHVTTISITESMTVPAGIFTGCHHYYISYVSGNGIHESTSEPWFKSGVGFVQRYSGYIYREAGQPEETQLLKSKLIAYHLN